jgi:hypothetical protein
MRVDFKIPYEKQHMSPASELALFSVVLVVIALCCYL